MHYITGTTFIVKPIKVKNITSQNAKFLRKKDRRFPVGSYTLGSIRPVENKIKYTFTFNGTHHKEICVDSTLEMDKIIAGYRSEQIPDYAGDIRLQN